MRVKTLALSTFVCLSLLQGCKCSEDAKTNVTAENAADETDTNAGESEAVTDLVIEDINVGDGEEATDGKEVTVHYTGTLQDGTKFDSSVDRGEPFSFTLGAGSVIKGWEEGVKGMKIGGKRKLVIPPHLAYGDKAVGGVIPANSVLVFDVELLGVK